MKTALVPTTQVPEISFLHALNISPSNIDTNFGGNLVALVDDHFFQEIAVPRVPLFFGQFGLTRLHHVVYNRGLLCLLFGHEEQYKQCAREKGRRKVGIAHTRNESTET